MNAENILTERDRQPSRFKKVIEGPFGILIFGWGLGLAAIALAILFVGLSLQGLFEWSFDEVARVPHPSASLDAVLVETNGGATTSFGYEVFILPRGGHPKRSAAPVASLYGAGRNERAYGVNLRWQADDTLVVEYLEAQHTALRDNHVTVNGRAINVLMKSGVNDPAAPPGGMLYNLERRRR